MATKKLAPLSVPPRSRYQTARAALTAALKLIQKPGRWAQYEFAVNCDGVRVKKIRSKSSVAFCALGAVKFIDGPGEKKASRLLARAAYELIEGDITDEDDVTEKSIFDVNDNKDVKTSRRQVIQMFKRAIAMAKDRKLVKSLSV